MAMSCCKHLVSRVGSDAFSLDLFNSMIVFILYEMYDSLKCSFLLH